MERKHTAAPPAGEEAGEEREISLMTQRVFAVRAVMSAEASGAGAKVVDGAEVVDEVGVITPSVTGTLT